MLFSNQHKGVATSLLQNEVFPTKARRKMSQILEAIAILVAGILISKYVLSPLLKQYFSKEEMFYVSQLRWAESGEIETFDRNYDELPPGEYRIIATDNETCKALMFFYKDYGPNVPKAPLVRVHQIPNGILVNWREKQLIKMPLAA